MLFDFCCSANMQDHSLYLTPCINSCKVNDFVPDVVISNIDQVTWKPVFRRQTSLPTYSSTTFPVHVSLICDKHAIQRLNENQNDTLPYSEPVKRNFFKHFSPVDEIYENDLSDSYNEKVSLKNVLLSDSESYSSKVYEDSLTDSIKNGKYLESVKIVTDWDDSVFKDFSIDSESASVIAGLSLNDQDSSSLESRDVKPEIVMKKTRFQIDELKPNSDDSENLYETLDLAHNTNSCGNNSKNVEVNDNQNDTSDNDKCDVSDSIKEDNKSDATLVDPEICRSPVKTPNTPDSPGNLVVPRGLFLKCKSLTNESSCITLPTSALPCSDYGGVSHAAAHPQPPQGSKRGPFSRSLSNADVPADEHGGKSFNF